MTRRAPTASGSVSHTSDRRHSVTHAVLSMPTQVQHIAGKRAQSGSLPAAWGTYARRDHSLHGSKLRADGSWMLVRRGAGLMCAFAGWCGPVARLTRPGSCFRTRTTSAGAVIEYEDDAIQVVAALQLLPVESRLPDGCSSRLGWQRGILCGSGTATSPSSRRTTA